jgi:SAM-dependent methyltransferase
MANGMTETKQEVSQTAALANLAMFDKEGTAKYALRSPHLRYACVRELYASLVVRLFNTAKLHAAIPRVLDLGAGEGSVTLPFLELGAHVNAVDISESQLASLAEKCGGFGERLEVRHEAISETFKRKQERYDVVVMNSFLHHIPDYLSTIHDALSLLQSAGQFFSFQDPLRYDTLGHGTRVFSQAAYFSWRVFQGDYLRGLKTRIRRVRRIYIPGSKEDDAEYHVTRNGVNQESIADLLRSRGFACEVIRYFSTQSWAFQVLGTSLGIENTFAIIARRCELRDVGG